MRMILLAQGAVHYELAGPRQGPLVVLLHGAVVPMWTWDAQVAALLSDGFQVLRYDMFGRGLSDGPRGASYDRAFFCGQLAALLEALDLREPAHLVGYSFGAAVAAQYTALQPQRVASLALVAPPLDYGATARLVSLARITVLGGLLMRLALPPMLRRRAARLWAGSPRSAQYAALFAAQLARRDFVHALVDFMRSDSLGDYTQAYAELGRAGRSGLLVWAGEDEEMPRERTLHIARLAPGLSTHELEGAGHGIPFQHPQRLSLLLAQHLASHAGSAYAPTELAGLQA